MAEPALGFVGAACIRIVGATIAAAAGAPADTARLQEAVKDVFRSGAHRTRQGG